MVYLLIKENFVSFSAFHILFVSFQSSLSCCDSSWVWFGLPQNSIEDCFVIPMEKKTSPSGCCFSLSCSILCTAILWIGKAKYYCIFICLISWRSLKSKVAPPLTGCSGLINVIVVLKRTNDLEPSMCIRVVVFIPEPDSDCVVYLLRIQSDIWNLLPLLWLRSWLLPAEMRALWVLLL